MLLQQAGIQFKLADQSADEGGLQKNLSLNEAVSAIALKKMEHVVLPEGKQEGEVAFVISADTMGTDNAGNVCGKPSSKEAAINMLRSYRDGAETGTAFCVDRKVWKSGTWVLEERVQNFVSAKYIFDVPEDEIERYFQLSIDAGINYMNVSGAVAIEEFGAQYLKTISGSYTAVVGLPVYEVKEALVKLGFKF
jgi:septum formation protein